MFSPKGNAKGAANSGNNNQIIKINFDRKEVMPVASQIIAFQRFLPGNHVLLGAAGVGKTRLLWSLLDDPGFRGENTVDILLTDSKDRFNQGVSPLHVVHVEPYATDLSWISEPIKPGIYFSSCSYTPRNITFLECLANYVRQAEGLIPHPIRLFIDFSAKHWKDNAFFEQLIRLHYISTLMREEGVETLSIWNVLSTLTNLPSSAQSMWKDANFILLSPVESASLAALDSFLVRTPLPSSHTAIITGRQVGEFFYLPRKEEKIYKGLF